jgi:hypothetical protein
MLLLRLLLQLQLPFTHLATMHVMRLVLWVVPPFTLHVVRLVPLYVA